MQGKEYRFITSGTEPRKLTPGIDVVSWRMITSGEINLF
jgi:hypothetical protein